MEEKISTGVGTEEGGNSSSFSRRDALKRMAKIAAGAGLASVVPAALTSCFFYDDYYSDYYYYYGYYGYYVYYY